MPPLRWVAALRWPCLLIGLGLILVPALGRDLVMTGNQYRIVEALEPLRALGGSPEATAAGFAALCVSKYFGITLAIPGAVLILLSGVAGGIELIQRHGAPRV